MNSFVIAGLVKRRAELAGDIEKAHEALRAMVLDLENLDATILQFDPDFKVETIKPKAFRPPKDWSNRGQMTRICLSILRQATEPLIPLHKMLQAVHLICSSKKGISAHQLHRTLEVDYKSAWFLAHRIREAMRTGALAPMGGVGGVIEVDETYIGRREGEPVRRDPRHKNMILTLVERGGGARSFHMDGMAISDIMPILRENVARESRVNTDEAKSYYDVGKVFAGHDTVNHGRDEYVRREAGKLITTNTVEGFYSIFKRGMKGVYQHCKEKHLHRYLAEFDFRYSNRVRLGVDDEAR